MVKTVADLNAEIDSQFPDNHSRSITPATQRTVLKDIVTNIPVTANQVLTDSGTPGPTTFLAGDNTWKPLSSAGAVTAGSIQTTGGTLTSATALYGDNTWKEPTVNVAHIVTTSGTPSGTTALFGDGTWKAPAGGGTTTITGGGLGFSFDSRASAISADIAATGAGGPNWIRTNGYATAGDGGHGLFVRTGTTPAYSNLIWFSSADGQKWSLVVINEPLRLEQAGGGITATGAANNAAVEAINSIFTTNKFGTGFYGFAGANFQLGYGTYNFASPWFVKGSCKITGQGSGFYGGYSTTLQFPAGSDGLVLGAAGNTNGRLYNTSGIYSDFDARASVIRDLKISGGWTAGTTTYAQNHTTGQRGVGILSKVDCTLENLYINGFAEFGVYIKGAAGGGGSDIEPAYNTGDNLDLDESYVCAQGYANSFACYRVTCEANGLDGFRVKGADANAGSFISCSATENVGWGFNDQCFLGNWYWGNHAASNGTTDGHDWKSGKQFGAYQMYGESQATVFVANYSEGDFAGRNSFLNGFHILIGGLMAGGFHTTPTEIFNAGTGGLYISPFHTPTLGGNFTVGDSNVDGEIVNFNSGDLFWRNQFSRLELGSFSKPNSFVMTMGGYSAAQGRAASIGSGEVVLSRGYWLGSPAGNEGFDMRFRGVYDGLPTSGQFGRGDHIDMLNPSAGGAYSYVCVTAGDYAGTPPVWKSKGNLAA